MATFNGNNNNDTLNGTGAIDVFNALGGDDLINTGGGNDTVFAGAGDDTINAGSGNEFIDGGFDFDKVSYAAAGAAVNVDLGAGVSSGGSGNDTLVGIEAVEGSAFNDTLIGGGGSEDFEGGAGNDSIVGGGQDLGELEFDVAFYTNATAAVSVSLATGLSSGGAGNDTLSGIEAVVGSAFNDTLVGDDGDNAFVGGLGTDLIQGGGGFDLAAYSFASGAVSASLVSNRSAGADGIDTLEGIEGLAGGDFNDTLTGNDQANLLEGGDGNDLLAGGGGNDTVAGGAGDDTVVGDAGDDMLQGSDYGNSSGFEPDADTLDYSAATSAMTIDMVGNRASGGGMGNDTISSFEVVIGSGFNDVIVSNSVVDSDNDVFIRPGAGNDTIAGGAGFDILSFQGATEAVSASLASGTATGGAGNDQFTGIEALVGGDGNDTLTGTDNLNNSEAFAGGLGNDLITGGAGSDDFVYYGTDSNGSFAAAGVNVNLATGVVSGGAGNDTLSGIEGVEGSVYNDTLTGTSGANEMIGGAGDDTIDAAQGDDQLQGGAGDDTLRGGAGNDNLHGGSGNDLIDGGADNDAVSYNNQDDEVASGGVAANLASGVVTGGWGNDTLVGIEHLFGSNLADNVTGSSGGNNIWLGDGNDTVDGGLGDDTLGGENGIDLISFASADGAVNASMAGGSAAGVSGTDTFSGFEQLQGSGFNDTLAGSFGSDRIDGGAGNDLISGSESNDTLLGGDGNDSVAGDNGDDSLFGGIGDDSLSGGDGTDILQGQAGNDTLDGGGNISGQTFDIADYRDATDAVTVHLGNFTATGAGVGTDVLLNMEGVYGSAFNDSITGSAAPDLLYGLLGNDTLDGGTGSAFDLVSYGFNGTAGVMVNLGANGTGNGTATGGSGTDVLISIEGVLGSNFDDHLIGDANANFFRGSLGNDTIDGGAGSDRAGFDFSGGSTNASLVTGTATGANGNDTLISIENLRGGDFNDTLEGDGANNVLDGRAGNDLLIGNAGNDTLNGENGNDTIRGGAGSDAINGGQGNDLLDGGVVLDRINLDDGNSLNFNGAFTAVQVSLHLGMANDGQNGNDSLALDSFTFITGTFYNDVLFGQTGGLFEQFEGGFGDDIIDGGKTTEADLFDSNRAVYLNASSAVQVNLGAGTATGGAGNDTLINITQVRGSQFGDVLTGSDRTDLTEVFEGRGGADTFYGRGGFDVVRYTQATNAVTINLVNGTASDGETTPSTDTFTDIEGARGSNFADVLIGGNAANGTTNRTGLETFQGEAGNDTIDGGQGYDRIDYTNSRQGVVVDLGAGVTTQDGFGGVDTFSNIEAVRGSIHGDSLTGSAAEYESFEGRGGNDTIIGLGGTDRADYADSLGAVNVNLATGTASDGYGGTDSLTGIEDLRGSRSFGDSLMGNADNNVLVGLGGADTLDGAAGNDTLDGGDGDDLLTGGLGTDSLVGGAGSDTANYGAAASGVTVNLAAGTATGGDGSDVLTGIENAAGSASADLLTGNDSANALQGQGGNDSLDGAGGNDTLSGGTGNDTLTGGAGVDRFVFDAADGGDVDRVTDLVSGERLSFGLDLLNAELLSGNNGSALLAGQVMVGSTVGGVTRLYVGTDGVAGADRVVDLVGTYTVADFAVDSRDATSLVYETNLATPRNLVGTDGRDTLVGGNGNDTLAGGIGNDSLYGGAGNDSLEGGTSSDRLFGGIGNDTLVGGTGSFDRAGYTQASGAVTVNLANGTATGADGTDTLIGMEGALGSRFADTLIGDDNTNILQGNAGNDLLDGAGGGDNLRGEDGDDTLLGGGGDDNLEGGLGNDSLTGGAGADTFSVETGGGTDRITDLEVGESISLINERVTVTGIANGNDASSLGLGQALVGTPSGGFTRVYLGTDAVAGADVVLDLAGSFSASDFALNQGSNLAALTYDPTANQARMLVGGDGYNDLVGGNANDTLVGGTDMDNLAGGMGHDSLSGGGGDDYIVAGFGSDTLDGGDGVDEVNYFGSSTGVQANLLLGVAVHGTDTDRLSRIEGLYGSAFSDRLTGNAESNNLYGDDGNDGLEGQGSSDYLDGGLGDDLLSGGDGDDQLQGDDGNDTLIGGTGSDSFGILVNGTGTDRIVDLEFGEQLNFYSNLGSFNLASITNGDDASALAQGEVMVSSSQGGLTRLHVGVDAIAGADMVLELMGTFNASNFLLSGGGSLTLRDSRTQTGGAGTDYLYGDGGSDVLNGLGGDDSLYGFGGADTLNGGDGNDFLAGYIGNSGISPLGEDAADLLNGDAGNDTLRGNAGDDTLLGGEGDDNLRGDGGDDVLNGGVGTDAVSYRFDEANMVSGVAFNASQVGTSALVFLADGLGGTDQLVDVEGVLINGTGFNDTLTGGVNGDQITAGGGDDQLFGGAGDDFNLWGADGNDTIDGGQGADWIDGGLGNDSLHGGNGNDTLQGDAGIDLITGGQGLDSYDGGADRDVALFEDGTQSVIINLLTNQVLNDGWGNAESIVNVENLHGSSQGDTIQLGHGGAYVFGRAGNDSLTGGNGNDNLIGGSGNDTLTGGTGIDNADYFSDGYDAAGPGASGAIVNLATNSATDIWGNTDVLIGIENVSGSVLADSITGDAGNNFLSGNTGNDTLLGGGGNDNLQGGAGDDNLQGNLGSDVFFGGAGSDTMAGGEQRNVVWSSGLPGDYDRLEYNGTPGITVNLSNRTVVVTGEAGVDSYSGIEEIDGAFNATDVVTGRTSDSATSGDGISMGLYLRGGSDTVNITPYGVQQPWSDGATVYYHWSTTAINVDFTSGNTASVSYGANGSQLAGTDTLSNVAYIGGTAYNDTFDMRDLVTNQLGYVGNQLAGDSYNILFLGYGGSDMVLGNGQTYMLLGTFSQSSNGLGMSIDLTNGSANLSNLSNNGVAMGTLTFSGVNGLFGTNYADTMVGGVNDDFEFFRGSAGNDFIDGRSGYDRADYRNATEGITVNLALGTAGSVSQGTDTLRSIEEVRGSTYDDVYDARGFFGGSVSTDSNVGSYWTGFNAFIADGGNDTIYGNGVTRLSYANSQVGVRVDLAAGVSDARVDADKATDGYKTLGRDVFSGVFEVTGSALDDELLGAGSGRTATSYPVEVFTGGAGNDTIDGRSGYDVVSYTGSLQGIVVDLSQTSAQVQDGWGFVDTLIAIEQVVGSQYADSMRGGSGDDSFAGRRGADTIDGGAGYNEVSYSGEVEGVTIRLAGWVGAGGGLPVGFQGSGLDAWGGIDVLKNIGGVEGTNYNDLIVGDGGNNRLDGRGGNDTIDGGTGNDWIEYDQAIQGVVVDLSLGQALDDGQGIGDTPQNAAVEQDVLISIENVQGGYGNDLITGSAGANELNGEDGNDTLIGNGGHDTLDGGAGADSMAGGTGDDVYVVDNAADTVTEGASAGNDEVRSSVSHTLAANVETLRITSGGAVNAVGNTLDNLLVAGAGNNTLDGGAGNDTVSYAGAGSAITVSLALGTAQATGGSGSDTLVSIEHLVGSNFSDSLTGNSLANNLAGGIGNDTLVGGDGNDTLDGGAGADSMTGGAGDDVYTFDNGGDVIVEAVGGGIDEVRVLGSHVMAANVENLRIMVGGNVAGYGNSLDNILFAGTGDNTLNGGAGNDTAHYGSASSAITLSLAVATAQATGGSGTDTLASIEHLVGSGFNDSLTGNSLSNNLAGGVGADTLTGGDGNDTLDGGSGADSMTGGLGDDVYLFDNAGDLIVEDLGGGTDEVRVLGSHVMTANVENLRFLTTGAADAYGNSLNNVLFSGAGNNLLNGGSGTDTASYVDATSAVTVSLAITTAQATGGAGSDTLASIENLVGSVFADVLTGNTGANLLTGGLGNDTLNGGDGNDTLDGGSGADTMTGGLGDDVYLFDNAGDLIVEDLGGGTDEVRVLGSHVMTANVENLRFLTTGAADAYGNSLNNVLFSGAGNNLLNGGSGTDTASYVDATSAVTISLAITTAQATGGAGSDTLASIENLVGSAFADVLTGNTGANLLTGGLGNDTLNGDAGNDTLDGGSGADTMTGGLGDDVYLFDNAGDLIVEAVGGGTDEVRVFGSHVMTANVENLRFLTAGTADAYGNGLDNVLFSGAGNNVLSGGAGTDTANYTDASSAITVSLAVAGAQATGGSGADNLSSIENLVGSAFNDNLSGNTGANNLAGGLGADTLNGDAGNDTLDGGSGADSMTGGLGDDVYTFDNAGDLIIEAVGGGTDEVRVLGSHVMAANIENLRILASGTVSGFGNGSNNLMTGAAGNNTLNGGAGHDTLVGGAGNDSLTGGTGNDVFVFDSLIGSDTITDFTTGIDQLRISQAGVAVGNGDTVVNGAATVAGPGGFAVGAELVAVTGNIAGAINAVSAATAIGSATSAYSIGTKALFLVDNGTDSALFLFTAANADALVNSSELSLLAQLTAAPAIGTSDLLFGS